MFKKHLTEEHKKRISEANRGKVSNRKGVFLSEETKKKMSLSHIGKHQSIESKRKESETQKRIGNKPPSNKGLHFSEKHKRKISEAHKGMKKPWVSQRNKLFLMIGKKHPNWQGGKSFEPYPIDWTDRFRETIRKRDNYVCQLCGIHQDELKGFNRKLDIHHIDYDKDNLNLNNFISLCRNCHLKTNFNRDYWIKYFIDLKTGEIQEIKPQPQK